MNCPICSKALHRITNWSICLKEDPIWKQAHYLAYDNGRQTFILQGYRFENYPFENHPNEKSYVYFPKFGETRIWSDEVVWVFDFYLPLTNFLDLSADDILEKLKLYRTFD